MTAHLPTASVNPPNTNVQLSLALLQKKKFNENLVNRYFGRSDKNVYARIIMQG